MNILSIETSCDETAAAIVAWSGNRAQVLANTVSSQASLHAKWGGVVPSLAKREHSKNLIPVLEKALKKSKLLKLIKGSTLRSRVFKVEPFN